MTAVSHIYVTVHGEFTSALWNTEKAQFGVRCVLAEAASAPVKGDTFTPQTNGDAVVIFGTASGTHGTLTKTWKCRVGGTGSLENFDATEQIDMAEDVWTFLNSLKAYFYSGFRFTHVKFAAIDSLGKTVGTAATYTFTTPLAGTGSSLMPPQLAYALSMRANIVGRSGRGRIYLPALSASCLTSDAVISGTVQTTMAAAFKTLIDNLQNVSGWSTYLPIVVVTSAGAATAVRPVEVRLGNRFDTIKSRRQQVDETYSSTAL